MATRSNKVETSEKMQEKEQREVFDISVMNPIIVHSNAYVNRWENKVLSAQEQRIIHYCFTQIRKQGIDKKISFTFQQVLERSLLTSKDYRSVRNSAKKILGTRITFREKQGDGKIKLREYNVFSDFTSDDKKGLLTFQFNQTDARMVEVLTAELTKNFTAFNFNNVKNLKIGFAYRIYSLLLQGKNKYRSREFSVDELRNLLGLTNLKSYTDFSRVRTGILKKSCDDLTKNTDINVDWEISGQERRKVTHITFNWDFKEGHGIEEDDDEDYESEAETPLELPMETEKEETFQVDIVIPKLKENSISVSTEDINVSPFSGVFLQIYNERLSLLEKEIFADPLLEGFATQLYEEKKKSLYENLRRKQEHIQSLVQLDKPSSKEATPSNENMASEIPEEQADPWRKVYACFAFESKEFRDLVIKYVRLLQTKRGLATEKYFKKTNALLVEHSQGDESVAIAVFQYSIENFDAFSGAIRPLAYPGSTKRKKDKLSSWEELVAKVNTFKTQEEISLWVQKLPMEEYEQVCKLYGETPKGIVGYEKGYRTALSQGINRHAGKRKLVTE